MLTSIAITPAEHRARCDELLQHTQAAGLSGVVLFDPYYILYYAGLAFVPTERPIAFVLGADADQDGYPWIHGYRGPTLSELSRATVVRVVEHVEWQLAIKSEAEIGLIRESVRWGNLAHRLLQRYTRVGATETEVSAGPVLTRARRLPAFRHRPRDGARNRDPHVLPARPRKPRHSRLNEYGSTRMCRRSPGATLGL